MSFRLSPTRWAIYTFILQYKRAHDGNSPSMREMAIEFNLSTSQISDHLYRLVAIGLLKCDYRAGKRNRAIEVVGAKWEPPTVYEFSTEDARKLFSRITQTVVFE